MLLKYSGSHDQFFGCCIKGLALMWLSFNRNSLFVSCQLLWAKRVWYFTDFKNEMLDEQCQTETGQLPKNCGRTSRKKNLLIYLVHVLIPLCRDYQTPCNLLQLHNVPSFIIILNLILLCLLNSCCSIQHLLASLATSLFQHMHLPGFDVQLIFIQQGKQL